MGIKKKIFLGWLAFEAIGLSIAFPAGVQAIDRVVFAVSPHVAHRVAYVVTPLAPGLTEIMVAANVPFMVLSENAVTKMSLSLRVSGTVNGNAFGGNAQNPGQTLNCVHSTTPNPTVLYTASQRTAANRGKIIDQAVMFRIKYDPDFTPKFTVKTLNQPEAKSAVAAMVCKAVDAA